MLIREFEGIYSPKNKVWEINIHFCCDQHRGNYRKQTESSISPRIINITFYFINSSPEFKTETKTIIVVIIFENNYAKAYDMDTY